MGLNNYFKNQQKKTNDFYKTRNGKIFLGVCIIFLIGLGVYSFFTTPSDSRKASSEQTMSKNNRSASSKESSIIKNSSKSSSSKEKSSTNSIISEVDNRLNTDLYQAMGWATGKLDGNGNPMPDGQIAEKRPDFDWSLYVNKMYYDNQFKKAVRIDLNKDGDDLSRAAAYNYMQRAQSSATASIYEVGDKAVKFFDLDENKPDVFVTIYSSDGNLLVTSSGLNNKLKQKDFLK